MRGLSNKRCLLTIFIHFADHFKGKHLKQASELINGTCDMTRFTHSNLNKPICTAKDQIKVLENCVLYKSHF